MTILWKRRYRDTLYSLQTFSTSLHSFADVHHVISDVNDDVMRHSGAYRFPDVLRQQVPAGLHLRVCSSGVRTFPPARLP